MRVRLATVMDDETLTVVAQENGSGADIVLLCDFEHGLVFAQWGACASQRAVRGDVNALLLAKVDNFLLGQEGMVLDLVDGWDNSALRKQLLEVLD
jgi:hypothetical protein